MARLLCFALLVCTWRHGSALNNPPIFTDSIDSVSFPELAGENAGVVIFDVDATDPDGDTVSYYIPTNSLNSNRFTVDNITGHVFTQPGVILDRELLAPDNQALSLHIAATDGNLHNVEDPLFTLLIVLKDVNDNHPRISVDFPLEITVAEDIPRNSVLLTVEATDDDYGANALVFYRLGTSSTLFSLEHQTGILRLLGDLDYDDVETRSHTIIIIAEDQGNASLSDSRTLTVSTSDINDLSPVFEPPSYSKSIYENTTQGQVIERVMAVDGDTGVNDDVFYTLEEDGNDLIDGQLSFVVDNVTGELSVNVTSLDRETYSAYTLTVKATEVNDSSKVAMAMVSITVLDNNDNLPTFDQDSYTANVSELEDTGRTVLTVSAADDDIGSNADFIFHLEDLRNSSSSLPFTIASDGTIILSDPLDFEETESYLFMVIAQEEVGGANGSAVVRVYVDNKNDLSPVFEPAQYNASISENVDGGAFIQQIIASDGDRGVFGEITYSLISGHFNDFRINTTAAGGAVFTERGLDYEARSSYSIIIQATDMPELSMEARTSATPAELTVQVVNINDNRPVFDSSNQTVQLAEESEPGSVVARLVVTDGDGDDFTDRIFSITSGNDLGNFTFHQSLENVVVTSEELDFDLNPALRVQQLTIVVNDTVFTDEMTLTIELVDINDNTPQFQNSSYQFHIYEEVDVGSDVGTVVAVDMDSGDLGEVVYSISDSDKFTVNSTTGRLTTKSSVNREEQSSYIVTITATDRDPDVDARRSQPVQATITVLDINDNSPRFSSDTYQFSFLENTATVEFFVMASDMDEGTNGEVTYKFINGNTNNAFVIDPDSGKVTRNANLTLDREEVAAYVITAMATDRGFPPNNVTATISITILDENDEQPMFSFPTYNTSIDEDIRENMIVLRVTATDMDTPPNAMLRFSISSMTGPDPISSDPNPPSGSFIIDPLVGDIRTQGMFDREAFEGPYVLQVIVTDNGVGGSLRGTAEVTVYLTDVNDNDPIFYPTTYSMTLSEELSEHQRVAMVMATDRDAGSNRELSYSISSVVALNNIENQTAVASHFAINATTGLVVTTTRLDYEFVQRYRITVTATDDGENRRSSSATITVTVVDVNDHTPQFSSALYSLSISEATLKNTRFSLLEVSDQDSGENSRLTFTADITSPFRVDGETGELVVSQTLDYESSAEYSFTVNVTDNGNGPRMNSSVVTVAVEDVNDNAPRFMNDSYSATIPEGNYAARNEIIITVQAIDLDSGVFSDVTYRLLVGNTGLFSLDNMTGQISVAADVDFESLNPPLDATEVEMQLVVEARDGGIPAMTSSVMVTVTITDENDNTPEFEGTPYHATLRENSLPGQEVIVVRATDEDGNRNGDIRYAISDSNNFSIDDVTGTITTGTANDSNTTLLYDYESGVTVYRFSVYAIDNGTTPQVADIDVTVTIEDVNDNSPVITSVSPSTLSINEASGERILPVTILVSDEDTGENAAVEYQLSNDGGLFSVNEVGNISLVGELDRETVDEYNITITVTDRGQPRRSDDSYLIVTVLDANDNAPTFEQDSYTAILMEDAGRGETVITLRVRDRDSRDGGAGELTFMIDAVAFILERSYVADGWWELAVKTETTFDYENGQRSYELAIEARDLLSPPLNSTTLLTITILDVNDNSPAFSRPSYTLAVPENVPAGGAVGFVLATDPDGANNGDVTYGFAEGTTSSIESTFSLDRVTGLLELLVQVDFDSGLTSYDFSVVAMDRGSPAMTSTADVRVNVQNINEQDPVFTQDQYSNGVRENAAAGFVLAVSANDSEAQNDIRYGIVTGSTADFSLDPETGVLSTRRPLDREVAAQYVLTVQAVDGVGSGSRTGYTQVTVTVEDENDITPSFPLNSFSYLIPESSPPSSALTPSLTATDTDLGANAAIDYYLQPPTSDSQPFQVDSSSGVVTLAENRMLDRETTPTYTLLLQAVDRGSPSRTGSIELTVTVTDVNDRSPTFDQTANYFTSVPENSPGGVSVIVVTATDEDSMDTITYAITDGDAEGHFQIDSLSGLISTGAVPLDREEQAEFFLTVTVMDSDLRTDEVEVMIAVGDLNDNSPMFSSETYSSTHAEGNENDLVVATVFATDRDGGSNGRVEYGIIGGNGDGVFYIDSDSGEVIANDGGLDYETQQVHTLTIEATDQAEPANLRLFSTAVVTVVVEDTNDNRPVFSQDQYRTTLTENAVVGTTVAVISATDGDSGTNGQIMYSFSGTITNVFSINSTTGVVTVSGDVNFEMGQDHELSVEARDRGDPQRSHVVSLRVEIINEEDESPRFPISFYTAEIDEDVAAETPVLTVTATDPDNIAGSGSLTYDIIPSSNGNSYFRINGATGEISTAGPLDRESIAVVDLQVIATDPAGHNGTAIVQITIGDLNDNAPRFLAISYTASLRENSAVGTTIIPFFEGNSTRVEARDIDGPGLNSEVSYDKEDGVDSDKFSVDKDTGIVTVAPGAVLNREEDGTLVLIITAEDHGNPERTGSVTMTITLLDENDNPPTFVPQFGYSVLVPEDQEVGSVLLTVAATDPDLLGGGLVSFRRATSSPLSKLSCFAVNSTTGAITLENSLDREEDPLITLTVSAHDSGVPSLVTSTTVQITVTDINDNRPQFSQESYIATVSEQHTVGAPVVTVVAEDPDSGTNGQVEYDVASINTPFTVNRDTGEVSTRVPLDYESQRRHDVVVEACDKGPERNCSTAVVTVYVTDFNDEFPLFDFSSYRTDLCHTHPPDDVFMHPVAIDRDSGSNAQLTYSLDTSGSDLMAVQPDSGRVYLVRGLTKEEVGSEVTAVLTATDGGNPMLWGTASVVLRVLNCTNDTFRFQSPLFEVEAREGSDGTLSSNIVTLPDQEDVIFSPELQNNPFTQIFSFLTVDGNTHTLDRETRDLYTLPIISMSESGDVAYATITVTLLDINDNVPQLQLPRLTFSVAENRPERVYVTTAVATDEDIGENAAIEFSFAVNNNNNFFAINATTGVITTVTELDREGIPNHQLSIQASDGSFESEAITITVTVSDVNDNAPDFSEDRYSVTVVENSPSGTSVLTVVATDDDVGENAAITFSIVGGDINVFSLNSETGVVRTTQGLDYEAQQQYSLTVRATDNGAPLLSSDVEVNITVEDFNDHIPMFLNPVTFISISEGVAVGTVLTDFNVTDSDSGTQGVLGVAFTIVAGDTDLFTVNAVSGILKTLARLDRDVGPVCQFLSIQATDSAGENSLSNVTEIEVCLIDENDNCPNFTQPTFSGQVAEDEDTNQQLLLRVQATDADSDLSTNGDVVYGLLEDGGVFDIDPSTGFLSLSSTLDTEAIPSYELVVEACDRGDEPCCVNTTIAVDVLDVNDNKPQILNVPNECLSVLETGSCGGVVQEVGDVIFTVNASDVDSGSSGAVLFSPLPGTTSFQLSAGGVITVTAPLDFEMQQNFQLFITARDQGVPLSMTSETSILCVTLVDINDEPPTFAVDTYSVSQDEGMVPESGLLQILATDKDTVAENAMVSYSITSGNTSLFNINNNGELFLEEELDCELISSYTLTVLANNSLSRCPLSAEVAVVITVNDVNDNSPAFSQDFYEVFLSEDVSISTPLLTIEATDEDKDSPNNDLLYRLELGNGPNPFHLDQTTGLLTVQNSLDAETLPGLNYTLTVVVEDKGFPVMSNSTSVVIYVEDVNDQAPRFTQDTYSVDVSEGETFSASLLSLSFSDDDILPENRASQVAITTVTGHSPDGSSRDLGLGLEQFSVDENTTLQLLTTLDREDLSSYDITVTVTNTATCYLPAATQCSSTAMVTVVVTDVNDNRPKFTSQSYSGEVSVTASTGTSVLTVLATDIDSGNYGEVRYRVDNTFSGRFRIDEVSGVILTRGSFENLDGQRLTLTVTAYDNLENAPSMSSSAAVSVVVLNDFQRISVLFSCGIDTIIQFEETIINIIANVSGLDIQVERYEDYSNDIISNFIFHATDPVTNEIVDFDEFFEKLQGRDGGQNKEADLIARLSDICPVEKITAFANIDDYQYPDALDTQTIVIFILCIILAAGALTSLSLAIRQRWVALHDTRSKLLADVFYGSPGSTSLVENVQNENYELEQIDMRGGNRQNPMFVQPYDNWQGVDASGPESTGDVSSMNRDNPLYESQEIRMEMFADVSEEEEGDEADDAELLAAALKEDGEPEDNSVTAI